MVRRGWLRRDDDFRAVEVFGGMADGFVGSGGSSCGGMVGVDGLAAGGASEADGGFGVTAFVNFVVGGFDFVEARVGDDGIS